MNNNKPINTSYLRNYTDDPGIPSFRWLLLEPILLMRIVHLGWPVIVGMLTQSAINTIDLIMVGRLDDSLAVPGTAAIMASVILLWAYGGFLSSISVGTQALCARRFSEGHHQEAGAVLTNSIAVAVLASLVVTTLALIMVEPSMLFLSKSVEVQMMGNDYSHIRLLGLPSMALMASFKSFYDGIGAVKVHMCVAIIMNIVNIIANYFLIYGFEHSLIHIPAFGVCGAAWGSVISSYVGLIIMFLWAQQDQHRFMIFHIKNLNKSISLKIAKLSFWSGLATVVLMTGVALFNHIVSSIDDIAGEGSINASAASIITHIMMLVFMTCLAFGTSTATLVSQSIGVKNFHLAKRYVKQCVLLAVYMMSIFGILAFLFPKVILNLFLPSDLNGNVLKDLVIAKAIPSLKITALLLSPTAAAGLVLTQALYGAGETRYVLMVEFILHFFCLVPLAWFLAIMLNMGILGCWIAAIVYATGLAIFTGQRFIKGKWQAFNL